MRRARWLVVALLVALAALAPLRARPATPGSGPGLVTEALFLCDPLPPGGRDLNLTVDAMPAAGRAPLLASGLQLAMAIGDRLGATADVGLDPSTGALHSPAFALKALLRDPATGRAGLAASLDLLGPTPSRRGAEAALGLGLIAPLGRLTLRASASGSTPLDGFAPHLHAGGSVAAAVGTRWRLLFEALGELGSGRPAWSAGPTVKVALDGATSLALGALVDLGAPGAPPSFSMQLGRSL